MLSSTVTMQARYSRHSFYPAGTQGRIVNNTEQGDIATVTFNREEASISALQRNIEINTDEKGWITAIDNVQGSSPTKRGDFVIWGYFYADSEDVTWGDINNPEVFYKIWWDISGRIDVNFFHVSVPEMQAWSEFTYLTQKQQTALNLETKRYTRHEYFPEEVTTWVDSDDDGVPDHRDNCPGTSPEDLVLGIDIYGCPNDSNEEYYD